MSQAFPRHQTLIPLSLLSSPDLTFSSPSFTLDPRLLLALADQSFAHPTLVQAKAIPLLLEGRDVLARARTGSGKTAAYCLPGIQKVLEAKAVGPDFQNALIEEQE